MGLLNNFPIVLYLLFHEQEPTLVHKGCATILTTSYGSFLMGPGYVALLPYLFSLCSRISRKREKTEFHSCS